LDRAGKKQKDRGGEEERRVLLHELYSWYVFKDLQEPRALSLIVYGKRAREENKGAIVAFTELDVTVSSPYNR